MVQIEELKVLELATNSLSNLSYVYTFLLLVVRFTSFMGVVPGIGMGTRGLRVRIPAVLVMTFATMIGTPVVPLPADWFVFLAAFLSEVVLGFLIGIIPFFVISGVQLAMTLAGQTMGLGMASIIDPTMGTSISSLARIYGDLVTILFLLIGGHYVVIQALTGLGGVWVPGTFILGASSIEMLIEQSARIFEIGVIVSAPVIVALLLTQFVMGLISKAVPSVNIFIVSFPLTIGIGLVLSILAIPDLIIFSTKQFVGMDALLLSLGESMQGR